MEDKGVIYIIDSEDEEEINHPNAENLGAGFYIVQGFKKITKPTVKKLNTLLASGQNVYKASCYGGSGPDDELFFTGTVIWRCNDPYETSAFAGVAMSLGNVPAGTLIVNVDDD